MANKSQSDELKTTLLKRKETILINIRDSRDSIDQLKDQDLNDDLDYADDIRNYKDQAHYNIDMNSMHLDAIKNNTHILTTQNMDRYFELMEQKIRAYDLEPLIQIIKKDSQKN